MMTRTLMAGLLAVSFAMNAATVDAGVRGGRFEGTFTNSEGNSADLTIDFHGSTT